MIIPVRCYTCNKILADKWLFYKTELAKIKTSNEDTIINVSASSNKETPEGKILNKLELHRYCCRTMMLSHVDLIDII